MKTANMTPSPATVTNPPPCESSDGAPLPVALRGPPVVVFVEFPLPVADARALLEEILLVVELVLAVAVAEVPADFSLEAAEDEVAPEELVTD